jgi:hypothetical protein
MAAEDLVIMRPRRRNASTGRMVRSVSYPKGGLSNKTGRAIESDHDGDLYDDDDGMDCRRDEQRLSMYRYAA